MTSPTKNSNPKFPDLLLKLQHLKKALVMHNELLQHNSCIQFSFGLFGLASSRPITSFHIPGSFSNYASKSPKGS